MPKTGDAYRKLKIDKLLNLQNSVLNAYNNEDDKSKINSNWLGDCINEFNGFEVIDGDKHSTLITYWIDHIIKTASYRENSRGGVGISYGRTRQYSNLKSFVESFQVEIDKTLHIADFDPKMAKKFRDYLLINEKIRPHTAKKKISDLKTVCREANLNDVQLAVGFEQIKFGKVKTYDEDMDVIFLDVEEIEKIQKLELKNDRLRNARKWLIALCYTGQRGIDLVGGKEGKKVYKCQFVKENFNYIDGKLALHIHQSKTNKKVTVPVLPPVAEMYANGLPRPISLQRLRDYFKDLGELAGIDTPTIGVKQEVTKKGKRGVKKERPKYMYFSTHTGRRSFCTNFYGELPTPYLIDITGHADETTLKMYINTATDDHLEEAHEAFARLTARKQKKSDLRVLKSV